ncbi:response regulator transcription factor [Roseibium sp. H3510]|uniref:Response regulator transcription factor n=1 Tax=Roseibium algae TaxID=3123038 RepID=A0ABU8TGP2_9HYPH
MPDTTAFHFIIADDHPLFRGALKQTLETQYPDARIEEAGALEDVTAKLEVKGDVDLVLLDLTMPGMRGFSGLMYLRAQYSSVPVVIVSANEDAQAIRRCIEFGASGFIPKSHGIEVIREAIASVMDGNMWTPPEVDLTADDGSADLVQRLSTLTPQQVRVLMMLSEGLLNKQIAYELTVSEATVKAHVSAILQKLGVESRTQAVIAAAKIEAGQWRQIGNATNESQPAV